MSKGDRISVIFAIIIAVIGLVYLGRQGVSLIEFMQYTIIGVLGAIGVGLTKYLFESGITGLANIIGKALGLKDDK